MSKVDLTKLHREYYTASSKPEKKSFGKAKYVAIEGKGEPAGSEFNDKVSVLYPVAYAVKKIYKQKDKDFAVPKLEGLWWVEGDTNARKVSRSEWCWLLLIRMPDFVKETDIVKARNEVIVKKKIRLAESAHFFECDKEDCVQMMHKGPYSTEPETIDAIHKYINVQQLKMAGLHHEIYLSDPRKTEPGKMRTILRQPVS